jgi:hypothetical protein
VPKEDVPTRYSMHWYPLWQSASLLQVFFLSMHTLLRQVSELSHGPSVDWHIRAELSSQAHLAPSLSKGLLPPDEDDDDAPPDEVLPELLLGLPEELVPSSFFAQASMAASSQFFCSAQASTSLPLLWAHSSAHSMEMPHFLPRALQRSGQGRLDAPEPDEDDAALLGEPSVDVVPTEQAMTEREAAARTHTENERTINV